MLKKNFFSRKFIFDFLENIKLITVSRVCTGVGKPLYLYKFQSSTGQYVNQSATEKRLTFSNISLTRFNSSLKMTTTIITKQKKAETKQYSINSRTRQKNF